MASEMRADVTATISALLAASDAVNQALMFAKTVDTDLKRRTPPLPAQLPTEEQIVAALKADPAMAGRVMVALGLSMDGVGRNAMIASAEKSAGLHSDRCAGLSRLAVALAAASYRG